MWPVPVLSMIAAIAISLFATALPAAADFTAITSRAQFEQLVQGRELRRFGIRLVVSPNGQIVGRAFGGEVTGAWDWNDGYFCRDLFYQGDDLGFNCQLVQQRGDTLRFTTDRGAGIYADLTLR